jgi:4-hydroxy-tetrahydrodipicolinate synthase
MRKLRGTYTVTVTPFTDDGRRVDAAALRRLIEFQVTEGIHGLIPLGSTGESLSVRDDERDEVVEVAVKQAAGRVPVVPGCTAENTNDAIRYARAAERLGADGVMVMTPYYAALDEDEIVTHFTRIGEAISIPVMLYNHPVSGGFDLTPPVVKRLSEVATIRYIKESTIDVRRVTQIQRLCGDRMTVFGGYLGFESFVVGAEGWVAVCANIAPRVSAEVFNLAVDEQDLPGAQKAFHQVSPLIDFLGDHLYVHGMKAAFRMIGMPMGDPRPPRLRLKPALAAQLRDILAGMGFTLDERAVRQALQP